GMATAVLYVALLLVLSLFADLMVNRGEIPALHNLQARGYGVALANMKLPDEDKDRKTTIAGWRKSLKDLGVDDQRLADLLGEPQPKLERDAKLRQHLIWFLELPKLIEDCVGSAAADEVRAAVKSNIQAYGVEAAVNRNLEDFGILSLTVRSRDTIKGNITN